MGTENVLHDRLDHANDTLVLIFDEIKFVVVSLELLFLKKNDLCAFWDACKTFSVKSLGLSDQFLDLFLEVDLNFLLVIIFL